MSIERLGPYRIKEPLGRGGMGTVYRGVNGETGEVAAIKVLAPVLAGDEAFRDRFEAEIETLKTLNHPSIVRLYGFGEEDGHLFYSMELVEGTSLEEELQNGRRFHWREVSRIAIDISRGLKHAHDCGVIHRDLKPANLLLSNDDQIKLTDFGIAKLFGYTQMTAQGGVLGTADYMAPEQAEGSPVTPRSDLYSLGSVMYALLSGRPPFRGKSMGEVLHMLKYAEPTPVRNYSPDAPRALEKIIAQLLDKDPQKRIPTALALSNVLQATEHALSIDSENLEQPQQNPPLRDQHFVVANEETLIESTSLIDSKAPTRVNPPPDPSLPELGADASPVPTTSSSTAAPHFTTIDQQQLGQRTEYGTSRDYANPFWVFWVKAAIVICSLVMVVAVIYHVTRPESADQLYASIEPLISSRDVYKLIQTEDRLSEFSQRFPDDPRTADVTELLEIIELDRLQNRFEKRARNLSGRQALTVVEQSYLETVGLINPDRRVVRLQALINVYKEKDDLSKMSRTCLDLACRQLALLQSVVDDSSRDQLEAITERLEFAGQIRAESPAEAITIWRGIIELYAEKPWATDVVHHARTALESSGSLPTAEGRTSEPLE